MSGLGDLAKLMIGVGLGIALLGLMLLGLSRFTPRSGWLPGDIVVQRPGLTVYFPIVTSLLLSVALSLIFLFIAWLRR